MLWVWFYCWVLFVCDPLRSWVKLKWFCGQETLVDFTLTPSDVWALWVDESNNTLVKYINFEL